MESMKNLKLLILAFISFVTSGYGQTDTVAGESRHYEDRRSEEIGRSRDAKRKLVLGLKAGINNSNVFDEQGLDFVADAKAGFAGGAFLAIPLGGFLGLQPEMMISQKGFMSTGRIDGDSYALERTTTYLDLPLQIQLKPFRFFSVVGGIQYSYLLNQKDRLNFGSNSSEHSQDFKNDNIRKNILGLVAGADINIQHFVLSGRMSWDLMANRGDGASYTPRYKNVVLQATLGYRFY
jgi:hypothetical protein